MDFSLFPLNTFPNGEKVFHFLRKTFPKHLGKYPLQVEVSLYMLMKNGDGLPIGRVRLIWRGYCVICCALYGEE